MNKILVAVDGGKKSQKIIDWALDMAAQENALLVAVNVFVPSSWHYSNFTYAYASNIFD